MSWPKWRKAFSIRQLSSTCRPHIFRPRSRPVVDAFEHVRGHIRADVELPAQLTDVGNPVGAGEAHANLDLLGEAEGMGVVAQIVRRHALQQLP